MMHFGFHSDESLYYGSLKDFILYFV